MKGIVYNAGAYFEPDNAKISIFDRGFLYGDSIYETLRVYKTRPFALGDHLDRFTISAEKVYFELPWSKSQLEKTVHDTITKSGLQDAYLRIIATRGGGVIGLDPSLATEPQLVVICLELPKLPEEHYTKGISAHIVDVTRNLIKSLDPQAKTGNYMNSILAVAEAKRKGAQEAIMLDYQGRVTEASASNLFAKISGVWCTPPLSVGILDGITRRAILAACKQANMPAEERMLSAQDLLNATEMFFCGSVKEVVPVILLNQKSIASGVVGDDTKRVMQLYKQFVQNFFNN